MPAIPTAMPRRSAEVAGTALHGSHEPTSSLDSMEMGDRGEQRRQQQLQRDSEQRVAVAATEVLEEEDNNRESAARSRRLLAQAVSVVLLGLVAGFGCFFAYVWVDSFRKVCTGCGSHEHISTLHFCAVICFHHEGAAGVLYIFMYAYVW